jgi:hypothetical protein
MVAVTGASLHSSWCSSAGTTPLKRPDNLRATIPSASSPSSAAAGTLGSCGTAAAVSRRGDPENEPAPELAPADDVDTALDLETEPLPGLVLTDDAAIVACRTGPLDAERVPDFAPLPASEAPTVPGHSSTSNRDPWCKSVRIWQGRTRNFVSASLQETLIYGLSELAHTQ